MPEWFTGLLTVLFGQLGALGTVCFLAAAYSAYLLQREQESHTATRRELTEYLESHLALREKHIEILAELRGILLTLPHENKQK